ncbi:MAG: YhfC family intramembrane metalloprotease [Planctomycetes bacterium]|nr:YhfC family intramembrane metalloprotease [Planctomycetota bacterium]
MDADSNLVFGLVSGLGMMIVAAASVILWRRVTRLPFRWFWVGAGLWLVAVVLKATCAALTNAAVFAYIQQHLPYILMVVCGGLYSGIQSSLFEIGLTLMAVVIWRQLGQDAQRAIGIGMGAGAFEAFLLGLGSFIAVGAAVMQVAGADEIRRQITAAAATTPLFWLLAPVERIFAILCHAASRALVLLGVAKRRSVLIVWGFLIFTLLDGVAGAAHISGAIGKISLWWIELAILPFALISLAILKRCSVYWWGSNEQSMATAEDAGSSAAALGQTPFDRPLSADPGREARTQKEEER